MSNQFALSLAVMFGAIAGISHAFPQQAKQESIGRSPVQRSRTNRAGSNQESKTPSKHFNGPAQFPASFRTIDGTGNNLDHPEWGAAETVILRLLGPSYADGSNSPAGGDRASAREISNKVAAQSSSIPNDRGASDFVWMWGQFLDHDIDETPVGSPAENFDIPVPLGDQWFDPFFTGEVAISLDRSAFKMVNGVRQQLNLITAYIDASNVYGADEERALELRTLDGTGRLKTSAGNLLPFNVNGFPNAPSNDASLFLAGDVRANEQVALTAMHTLFVREHNYLANRLAALNLNDGEAIYQFARAIVAAEIQAISYREFLPTLLGRNALQRYGGYRPDVDVSISNIFATAAYRFGHTMLSPQLLRRLSDGSTHPAGDLPLASAFFNPDELISIGLDPYLRGLSQQLAQEVDAHVIDDVRNFLFGPPGAGGFDLVSLNIQRGRDHGLPSYNDVRSQVRKSRALNFDEVSSDPEQLARLADAYSGVDDVDAWLGLLCEDHVAGALVGPTLHSILVEQFQRLRDGDRYWYQSYLPRRIVRFVENQTLANIIRRNTDIGEELPNNVFVVQ